MHKLKVPRYDKNLKPSALLEAELVEKIDSACIKITGMKLKQFGQSQDDFISVHLENADYNPVLNFVTSHNFVSVTNSSGTCRGNGIITNLTSRQGLILGPIYSEIKLRPKTQTSEKTMHPLKKSTASAATSLALITTGIANQLTLTPQKSAELESLRQAPLSQASFPNKDSLSKIKQLDSQKTSESDILIQAFLSSEQASQFIQNKKKVAPVAAIQATPSSKDALKISCEGDNFFDIEKGILSFQKNIKVREPRLTLDCSKELTVTHEGSTDNKANKQENKHGIKKIVAIGNVKFKGRMKDDKGVEKVIEGFADLVEFNYEEGTTILKGGKPYIIATEGDRWIKTETLRENQWILIRLDGSTRIDGGSNITIGGLKKGK